MSLGALGYVGYGVESTEGTGVAPTKYLPVSSFSVEDSNDFQVPDQIRHSRDKYIAMAAPYAVSGSMEMELIPNDVNSLFSSAFGAAASSGSYAGGGYKHDWVPGSTVKTFTFESSAADILVMRYMGMRVNTLEISAAFCEIVTAAFGLEGLDRAKQGGAGSPTYTNVKPFHFDGADVHVASGTLLATVKDFKWNVNNNAERIGTLRRTRAWRRMAYGMREVGLSLTLDFTDTAEYDRFLAATLFDVDLFMQGASGQAGMGAGSPILRIQTPNVMWNKVGVPLAAADFLEQSVDALIVAPIGGNIYTASLVCSDQTAP